MYAANPMPLYYRDGGLAAKAHAVENAGRHGDSHIIHVNDEELALLKQQWGEPTINPETGLHEFFNFGKILKVVKKVAPIAAAFIPGVGPLASAAISAGLNAADAAASGQSLGNVLKSGAIGGATGAIGGGALSGIGGAANTAANAAASTAGKTIANQAAAKAAETAGSSALKEAATTAATDALASVAAPAPQAELPPVSAPVLQQRQPVTQPQEAVRPNFWNRDFLGLGVKNKYAVPALALGSLAIDALTRKKDKPDQTEEEFFGPTFTGSAAPRSGTFGVMDYTNRYRSAKGGEVPANPPMSRTDFAVSGPGDGRSDDIPAMLSDGEYVMDAETVAMLGDGSTKAGAKKLDDFRVKIRKHKGAKLAKGKISAKAKKADAYMAGGRV